jgi:tellurite resistance protein
MIDAAQARSVVELMVLTAWADGHVEGSEALMIRKLAASHHELRDGGPTGEISRAVRERLTEQGLDACIREAALALTDPKYRELAFQCCAKVMAADGAYVTEEDMVLSKLQELFAFSAADVRRLLVLATHHH